MAAMQQMAIWWPKSVLTFHGKVKIALSGYNQSTYLTYDDSIKGQVNLAIFLTLQVAGIAWYWRGRKTFETP
jgi:hypothetical protein